MNFSMKFLNEGTFVWTSYKETLPEETVKDENLPCFLEKFEVLCLADIREHFPLASKLTLHACGEGFIFLVSGTYCAH